MLSQQAPQAVYKIFAVAELTAVLGRGFVEVFLFALKEKKVFLILGSQTFLGLDKCRQSG
jgi:hypothetical protein